VPRPWAGAGPNRSPQRWQGGLRARA